MQEKIQKEQFSYNDFLNMQKQMKMFGSVDQLLGMLPGVNLKQADREKISHARYLNRQFLIWRNLV